MVSKLRGVWAVRGATFCLWAVLAASCAFWGLKFAAPSTRNATPPPVVRGAAPIDPAALARLLGSSPQAVAAAPLVSLASRFSLVGVVAGRSRRGAALIAVDGKPAKPFRVGSVVEEGLWLQAVEGRSAVLAATANGPGVLTLELPPLRR